MANPYFKFKQFTVYQHLSAMKVGTDGVLLGACTPVEHENRILDVGTGTGLVALMLAQRCPGATVDALEVDPDAAREAAFNFEQAPWSERLAVVNVDFNCFEPSGKYDLIVSNPPFFIDSLKAPDANRTLARHAQSLSPERLLQKCGNWLTDSGLLVLIVPFSLEKMLLEAGVRHGWFTAGILHVYPKPGVAARRSVIRWQRSPIQTYRVDDLVLETVERHQYTDDFKKITSEFYLAH